ncbi:bifunctional UDP-sugar hydrolase/5'-nucleotidase [Bacillus sp. 31A1R]|uniref:Bifunctional UDP-sugar hydrolase/5'-nucleotidase n=1 Tax=Robertmurraya mangrovi TaxID=3098077 RepID=A0ABU5J3N5_9BACI|nr:bifunctional UDP-sugar hydrolase/5'-nucleotidase [Bacillus sp. 31A1R]MDZ5474029.1 bifunctional UDP-sugar hydrolase/5'-nucleotidase [Bacillus sp. 31A1R]
MKEESTCTFALLQTSDIHGNIFPTSYGNRLKLNAGLGKLATIINQEKVQYEYHLLIDNGDVIQGTPLTYYFAKFVADNNNPIISVLNELKYDAAVIGNHEFNFGMELLNSTIKQSSFPWLSANLLNQETNQPLFGKPYMVKEYPNGLRVAVLGVTTHYIPNWEDPKHIKGILFQDALEATKHWVKYIQEKETYDILVVSYHGGFERDLVTGEPTEALTGENQAFAMCQEIDGIDVLLTGHQHRKIATTVNGRCVLQPSFNGQSLGKVEIQLKRLDGKWLIGDTKTELLDVTDSVVADERILALSYEQETRTQTWLDEPVGKIRGDMMIRSANEVRLGDHPLIEFLNKVQMNAAQVDISCTALLNNESPGFSEHVTMRDIISNYIYPNTLKVIRITGQDIKDALELSASYFTLDNDKKIIVNPDFIEPKPQHYNYDMWEGIEYEFNISKPFGERVANLLYQGKPVGLNKEYEVVMNNYRAGGGGNYTMYKGKPVVKEIQKDMAELIAEYISKKGTVEATCNHNWRVIY